jgi:hydrogenase maturation protease
MAPMLLLACGNPLRGDDGFGLHLAAAARKRFAPEHLRVLAAQQWTPEMAAEIARASVVLFADAAVTSPAGEVVLTLLEPEPDRTHVAPDASVPDASPLRASHHMTPERLLACAQAWYGRQPLRAYLLVAGVVTTDCCQEMSPRLREHALPFALTLLERLLDCEREIACGQRGCAPNAEAPAAPGRGYAAGASWLH